MNSIDSLTFFQHGIIVAESFQPPDGTILNAAVGTNAAIAASKLQHRHRKIYSQAGTMAAATIPIHVGIGATLTVNAVKAGSIAACTGNATCTVDVKKNGTTILTSVITLDNANTARVVETGTISVASGVAGDFYEVVIAVNAGTGALGTGLLVEVEIDEAAV